MVKREKANYMIQSVAHAIDVLEELSKSGGEVGVTELSKRLKLHKNNVFRLLATLELRGLVEQNSATEDYRLGVKALQLGQSYLAQSTLVSRAQPILQGLVQQTGETASLAVLQNLDVQYPLSMPSVRSVRVAPRIAVSFAAKQCAVGRLLLCQLPDSVLEELIASGTPQDAAIVAQKGDLRAKGLIVDSGAVESDVVCIAHLVRGSGNSPVGAIELIAPQYRAKVDELMPLVIDAAQKLSRALGSAGAPSLASTIERHQDGLSMEGSRLK